MSGNALNYAIYDSYKDWWTSYETWEKATTDFMSRVEDVFTVNRDVVLDPCSLGRALRLYEFDTDGGITLLWCSESGARTREELTPTL